MMVPVLTQAVRRRRTSLLWWSLGLVGVVALLAVAYPTVRDNAELDRTFAGLPPEVQGLLGLGGQATLTSPVGYLNSQFFANLLPVMLLVFAVGVAAWAISGDEAAGTLELLLANPVGRGRVAAERAGALVVLVAALAAVCGAALIAMSPAAGLEKGVPAGRLLAATLACALLAWSTPRSPSRSEPPPAAARRHWPPRPPPPWPASSSRASPSRSRPCARSGRPAPGTGCSTATRSATAWAGGPGPSRWPSPPPWSSWAPSDSSTATCADSGPAPGQVLAGETVAAGGCRSRPVPFV